MAYVLTRLTRGATSWPMALPGSWWIWGCEVSGDTFKPGRCPVLVSGFLVLVISFLVYVASAVRVKAAMRHVSNIFVNVLAFLGYFTFGPLVGVSFGWPSDLWGRLGFVPVLAGLTGCRYILPAVPSGGCVK